ncbi:MAG: ankyrin repeat domain-containing protein, partial [Acidobacteria bacterium]|nr:ankyrin repeat domain-containing protein [Acidobacteriota bacterium]
MERADRLTILVEIAKQAGSGRTEMRIADKVAGLSLRVVLLAVFGMSLAGTATAAPARDLPLVEAARAADADAVRALLERNVDVDGAETDGTTALHWAAYRGQVETARLLLGAGADVEAANRYGVTPLALAAGRGSAAIVEALHDAGA